MPISAEPTIIPSKTLDKYWVRLFAVGSETANGTTMLHTSLLPFNDNGDVGPEIQLDPINVLEQVAVDPDAAEIFELVLAYVEKKAKEQGKIQSLPNSAS